MNHIHRLSDSVYVGLCDELGGPREVSFRREIHDISSVINLHMMPLEVLASGSRGEGLRLVSSDLDYMSWHPNHKVICDISQISLYRIPQHTVILMECDGLQPGFTRLRLMSPFDFFILNSLCVDNNKYISSIFFLNVHLQLIRTITTLYWIIHGPCCTIPGIETYGMDLDMAFCFRSNHWPTTALPWIQRCRQRGWPSEAVMSDILSGGFHVVPISSTPENGEEWRISFSKAEKKLVYSLNHCQLMCYGLLKIFLKEVLNNNTDTHVLCSYFLKTILFWVIQTNNSLTWAPDTLLLCFWNCFKLLIYWVRIGECPNFFIPQNNMFLRKVTGPVQTSLFSQLYGLYCKGISCLLLSETIRPYLTTAILYRTLDFCTDETSLLSDAGLDYLCFKEFEFIIHSTLSIERFAISMTKIEKMIRGELTSQQAAILQLGTSNILKNTALLIYDSMYPNKNHNKVFYYKTKKVPVLLKLSSTIGCVSDLLYLAMYSYRTRTYEHSLSCLQIARERLSSQFILHHAYENEDMYGQYTMGMSLCNKIKRVLVMDIFLLYEYTYIDEVVLEQTISRKNGGKALIIPPLVILHMLLILNHHNLNDTFRSNAYIRDLRTLLLSNDSVFICPHLGDISWQILGICQQTCGDYTGAAESYQYSLQQIPFNRIQEATLQRMNTLAYGTI